MADLQMVQGAPTLALTAQLLRRLLQKNKGRASLNLQNFLLTANEEEITIPRDVVYAAANEYISRNLGISSIDLQFSVTVTDVNGETATGTLKLSLTLEPPTLTLKSKDNFSIHKGQSIDLSVTADYCPLVATAFDSGVLIQWTASCADDSRTADQLLSLSSDQTTATVRPYTLTPGYKYIVSVTFRYSANASLSDTKSFTINVGTDQVKIRFQFAPYPEATS
ncbi:hypothetical protein, conserved [Eimeria tenella]|uniref:REJ domain-containing protein n=1 Tax=Eimeria tenella TaxID=5802 RepID=U6KNU6_EIMTE|nr:hypothetical protein, conserved [Eimeria tenella]CDJ38491.1 hypothetical protein, conserved [Eimeria tenella]|eukprot:XP_013229329.1 hypothetical protein, conserved [Eimeria tenella]